MGCEDLYSNNSCSFQKTKKIQGLVSGKGTEARYNLDLIDSNGLRDGNGLTNGNGITLISQNNNSYKRSHKYAKIRNAKVKKIKNRIFSFIILVLLILLPFSVYIWGFNNLQADGIIIDGQFYDWQDIEQNQDVCFDQNDNVNVDLIKYQGIKNNNFYSFYVEVYGSIFQGVNKRTDHETVSGFDSIHIFIDSDCNLLTGYRVKNIGAEYLIEVQGCNNIIYKSSLKKFNENMKWYDWDGWKTIEHGISTGIKDKRFETQLANSLIDGLDSQMLFLFHIQDSLGNEDFSDEIIALNNEILHIDQREIGDEVLVLGSEDNSVSQLSFVSEENDVQLESLTLTRIGTAEDFDTSLVSLYLENEKISVGNFINGRITFNFEESILIAKGEPTTLEVRLDVPSNANKNRVIGVELKTIEDVQIDLDIPKVLDSSYYLKYLSSIPEEIIIDGAFGDWYDIPINQDYDRIKVPNKNVDINEYQVELGDDHLSLCFQVQGKLLAGGTAPVFSDYIIMNNPSEISKKNDFNLKEKRQESKLNIDELNFGLSGKDSAKIFINTDSDFNTGFNLPNFLIGAEFMLEITGKNGEIIDHQYYKFKQKKEPEEPWEKMGLVKVGSNKKKLETQIPLNAISLNPDSNINIFFYITSWNSDKEQYNMDITDNGYTIELNNDINKLTESTLERDIHFNNYMKKTRGRGTNLKQVINGTGNSANDCFGWNVSYAGDINKDGYSDVIIGAPFNDSEGTDSGAAYIFFGNASINLSNLNSSMADVTIYGADNEAHFGWDVSYAGDFDNDSYDDIIISAPDIDNGTVYIFSGRGIIYDILNDDGILNAKTEANITINKTKGTEDRFGFSISYAGDVNNDGIDDVLVGSPRNQSGAGAAYIYFGNDSMASYINASDGNGIMYGENSGDEFGFSVSSAGDVNNDSYDDVIIGAPGYNADQGRAYIYYGSKSMLGWTTDIKFAHWDESDYADYNPPGYGIYKNQFLAQSFTPDKGYKITKVGLYIQENGATPGTLVISLQGDNNGPDDNITSYAPSRTAGPTSLTWVEFEFIKPYQVTAGDKYWIVASGTGNNALNCWEWLEDDAVGTDYPGNNGAYSGGAGKSWTHDATTSDYWFKVYGQLPIGLEPNVTLTGSFPGDSFGWSVSEVGDLGKDGYDDVIIGAPGTVNGSVYIINGSSRMIDITVTYSGWGEEKMVSNWETGGDLELVIYNDSFGDEQSLAQSFIPTNNINLTKVSLYVETFGVQGSLTVTLMGSNGTYPNTVPNNNTLTQASSISTGNLSYNWEEFIFNTPYECKAGTEYFIVANGSGIDSNNCWVWYVQASGSYAFGDYAFNHGSSWIAGTRDCYFRAYGRQKTAIPNITIEGNPGDGFGMSVGWAEDINNDGINDIIVGAPYNDSEFGNKPNAGAVYVFYGNNTLTNKTVIEADNVTYGECSFDYFGWSVNKVENFNDDEYQDIIVGSPKFDNNFKLNAGKIYILSYNSESEIPELSNIAIPIFLIIMIIAIVRKRHNSIHNKKRGGD